MKHEIGPIIQVGIVVGDLDRAVSRYEKLLGWKDWNFNSVDTEEGKGARFTHRGETIEAKAKIAWKDLGTLEIELIEPLDENSVYAEFLRDHGPGLHHVMLAADDYPAAVARVRQEGCPIVAGGELQDTRFALVDAVEDLGLLIEFAEGGPLVPEPRAGNDDIMS